MSKTPFSYILHRLPETARNRSFLDSPNGAVFLPFQLEPPLRFNKMRAAAPTSRASHPETVEAGLAVTKLGRSSVTYAMDIFKQGGAFAAAQGHLIHVYVDRATQRPTDTKSLRGGDSFGSGGFEAGLIHRTA
jgi:hypothetical protein